MNKSKAKELIAISDRTTKIISMLLHGDSAGEIVRELGVNRQLVDYYIKVLREDKPLTETK